MNGPRKTSGQWTVDTLMEHFIALLSEKEKRDQEVLKRLDGVAASQEKAVTKAEEAQKEYNARSNEFRGQLDDQNKLQITRTEAMHIVAALSEKVDAHKRERERDVAQLRTEIQGLRESRSVGSGRDIGLSIGWKVVIGGVGLLGAVLAILITTLTVLKQ